MNAPGLVTEESRAKKIWRTVGRTNPYNKVMLWMLALYPLLSTLLYDAPQFGITNPRLWIAALASTTVMMLLYVTLMYPFYKLPALQRSTLGKGFVVTFAYLVKAVVTVLIVSGEPAVAFELWVARAPGDISVTIISWVALSVALTSNLDYRISLAKLNEMSAELEDQRQARSVAADVANQKLKYLAIDSLQVELDKIVHGLKSVAESKDAWRISAEIKNLIETKVRPLSQNLIRRIDLLAEREIKTQKSVGRRDIPHLKFAPRLDSRIALAYLAASVNIALTVAPLTNVITAAQVLVVSTISPILAVFLSYLWPAKTRIRLEAAMLWMVFATLVTFLPTLWIINYSAQSFAVLEPIQLTAFLLVLSLVLGFSMWAAFQRTRDEQLAEVEVQQEEIMRELALIDQSIWLARRKWAYLIHGTVQGALTVAQSRLVFNEEPTREVVKQVLRDVEKAKRVLQEPIDFSYNTKEMIASIQKSWQDICNVHFELPNNVIEKLDQNEACRACFIELAKELTSNAYRHGKAKNIWISAFLDESSGLRVIASNDGLPIPEGFEPGIGFEMFDELTQSWEIDRSGDSRFVATLPLGKSNEQF